MLKKHVLSFSILYALMASGCATLFDGTSQVVTFNSQPNGVKIFINGVQVGVTPLSTQVKRSKSTIVLAQLEGYADQQVALQTKVNTYFWGNIIIGGVIGSTTDYVSDAMVEYAPNTYYITLNPVKASQLERERFNYEKKLRNFILVTYSHLIAEMAQGEGEYLYNLYSMLGVQEKQYDRLKDLASYNQDPLAFAETVLKHFSKYKTGTATMEKEVIF